MKITHSNGIIYFKDLEVGDVFEFSTTSISNPHMKFRSLDKTIYYNAISLERATLSCCDDLCEVIKLDAELIIKR